MSGRCPGGMGHVVGTDGGCTALCSTGRSWTRCLALEPPDSPHGGNGWTCDRVRWHLGKHRLGNYVWPLPCDCGCPPGPHADYRPTWRDRLRRRFRRTDAASTATP